jgi:hypothetical protein
MNTDKKFIAMIKDKRVALVGPGRTETDNHDYIENCDTVVRCGQTLPVLKGNEKFYGVRTDIIYNSMDNTPRSGGNVSTLLQLWKDNDVKLVCNTYPKGEFFYMSAINSYSEYVSRFFPVKQMNTEIYMKYKNLGQSRPNSGFCALFDLFESKPKELYVVGIDMMRGVSFKGYKPAVNMGDWTREDFWNDMQVGPFNHHNPDKQYMLFKKMYRDTNFIKLDPTIQEIFNNPKNDKLIGKLK